MKLSGTVQSAASLDPRGRRDEQVVGGGDREQVGDRAAVPAAGLAESEGRAGAGVVGGARAEAAVAAPLAAPAGDLEGDEHALADAPVATSSPTHDDLGDGLVADGERPGEDPERRHRQVEVAAGDGERPDDRAARVGSLGSGASCQATRPGSSKTSWRIAGFSPIASPVRVRLIQPGDRSEWGDEASNGRATENRPLDPAGARLIESQSRRNSCSATHPCPVSACSSRSSRRSPSGSPPAATTTARRRTRPRPRTSSPSPRSPT